MEKRFDVILIGSGAGGDTLARHLAPSGKNLLILERGDWLKREAENWDAAAVFERNRYVSPDTWYDRHGRAFQPQGHYFVGGATKLFGAARELDNLYVVDTSFFVSIGAVNPSLTVMANAIRVGDQLLQRLA
jgi:choline dehydrogenase-like flavoprotein